jgi:cystathionine beta-lyase/cystathionine gamma-synthase
LPATGSASTQLATSVGPEVVVSQVISPPAVQLPIATGVQISVEALHDLS